MSGDAPTILLADQQVIFRQGLAAALRDSGWAGVQQVGSYRAAEERLQAGGVDILVIDYALPGIDPIETCRVLCRRHDSLRILLLAAYERDVIELRARSLQAGAAGCMSKEHEPDEYALAVRLLARGMVYYQLATIRAVVPPAAYAPISQPSASSPEADAFSHLTDREREILHLISRQLTNAQIGHQLSIAENTVMKHVSNLIRKLNVRSRTDAMLLYLGMPIDPPSHNGAE